MLTYRRAEREGHTARALELDNFKRLATCLVTFLLY